VRNKQTIKIYFAVLALLLASISLQAAEPPLTHSLNAVTPPVSAPALKLENMDEELLDIQSLKGKTVIVNFWATWCPPCRREMSSLEKLHRATEDKNVVVLAVNIGEDLETVFSFMSSVEPSPTFDILFDKKAEVMERWGVVGLPTTYVLDPEGQVVYKAVGGREFDHPDMLEKVMSVVSSH